MGEQLHSHIGGLNSDCLFQMKLGDLNITRFENAVNLVVSNHDMLRAIVQNENYGLIKQTIPPVKINIIENASDADMHFNQIKNCSFDVKQFPGFKFTLLDYPDHKILFFHCCLFFLDIGSWISFFKQVVNIYQEDLINHNFIQVGSFVEFTNKLHNLKSTVQFNLDLAYWLSKDLSKGRSENFPLLTNEPLTVTPEFQMVKRELASGVYNKIRSKCHKIRTTPTVFFIGVYALTMMRWSNTSEIIINLVASYKNQLKGVLGNYGSPIPLIAKRTKGMSIADFLVMITKTLKEDLRHMTCSITDIISQYKANSNTSTMQSPLFPFVFTPGLATQEIFSFEALQGCKVISNISKTANVWIDNHTVANNNGQCIIKWDYVEQLFARETIAAMHGYYCNLIEFLSEVDWQQSLPSSALPEYDHSIIYKANSTWQSEVNETLIAKVLSSIKNNQDRIAIKDASGSYSYKIINQYCDAISGYLLDNQPVAKGRLIAILSEKGYQQVVAALGIMQCGAAYLPLNISWPLKRCNEVLLEGQVSTVLVSAKQFKNMVQGQAIENKFTWLIIEEIINYIPKNSNANKIEIALGDLAYVIFTSGSTGKPKGVMISHKGALNTIQAINDYFKIDNKDRVLAVSELSFDLSVYDIFGPLLAGGTIVFPDQSLAKDPYHWHELILKHGITIWNSVPQLMLLLAEYATATNQRLDSLNAVFLSGDHIPVILPNQIKALAKNATVVSLGGATEGSIWSIWYKIEKVDPSWKAIPYGTAMPNQKMYVLNEYAEDCPVGVTGEIYIGGDGVAVGYWNDEAKSRASFVEDAKLGRLYKTGDLGKWHQDGYIEFIRRLDNQTKINGYRVELGEVENKLVKLPGIAAAIAKIHKVNGNNFLIVYLLPNAKMEFAANRDKEAFKLSLPGIRKDLNASYKLNLELTEQEFRQRKSYRRFDSPVLDIQLIRREITTTLAQVKDLLHGLNAAQLRLLDKPHKRSDKLTDVYLMELLGLLACIQFEDRVLPKYLYPSAGSSYAIRCYLRLANTAIDDVILNGYYYYNPLTTELCQVIGDSEQGLADNILSDKNDRIDLVVNWNAIKPLYGSESIRFAYLEAGHILALLAGKLKHLGLNYSVEITNSIELDFAQEEQLLVRINLLTKQKQLLDNFNLNNEIELTVETFIKNNYLFKSVESQKEIDLKTLNIFEQAHWYAGRVLEESSCLVAIYNEPSACELVCSGALFQLLSERLYDLGYGSCMLGYTADKGILYSMAIGKVNPESKKLLEYNANPVPINEYVDYYLTKLLPEYMVPHDYIVIDKIPLNVNGKVDFNLLPEYQSAKEKEYIKPRNELERKICNVFANVLNLPSDNMGIKQDFFRSGGNSILAISLTNQLQSILKVCVGDVFNHRTPEKIAANCKIADQTNEQRINEIRLHYEKLARAFAQAKSYELTYKPGNRLASKDFMPEAKRVNNILLTGATGFLGINILKELLQQTNSTVYAVVRASNTRLGWERLAAKFKYYFAEELSGYRSRIVIVVADLESEILGLSRDGYYELSQLIDSVIHTAALVKHYGDYDRFYSANVKATRHLLDFTRLAAGQDFHFISTNAILFSGISNSAPGSVYDELDETPRDLQNHYIKTKYEGELLCKEYRQFGVKSNIYRIGNIAMMSNGVIQENFEDNGFIQIIIALAKMGIIAPEIKYRELSFADSTANAIFRLFNQPNLINNTFHVFNHQLTDITTLLQDKAKSLVELDLEEFIARIIALCDDSSYAPYAERFMLHEGLFTSANITLNSFTAVKTNQILAKLGFSWPNSVPKLKLNAC